MAFGWMKHPRRSAVLGAIAVLAVAAVVAWELAGLTSTPIAPAAVAELPASTDQPPASNMPPTLDLTDKQLEQIRIGTVGLHTFPIQQEAVGSIDFDENMSVAVYPPYQGKIITAFAPVGQEIEKGTILYTIDSPDLVQAELTLIAAAATYDQNNRALARAQKLYSTQGSGGIAQKDLDAAVQGQVSAEGALKAARDAVRIFGKTEAEIDAIVAKRRVDPVLVVTSPITGRVTARNAQPGLFVQPGTAPAPYSVADISTMWMLANVPEIDSAPIRVGQPVTVSILAFPGRAYDGRISTVGATVDPNLHTLLVRSDVSNPRHELRPGMFANFVIRTGEPVTSTAVPVDSVVREGDGTMTVWVTTDRHHFTQRVVDVGLQHDGYDQILAGLQAGEQVITEGAVFVDNMLTAPPED